jgi:hypothetical protein
MTSLTSQLLLRNCRWRHSPPSYFYDIADGVTHLPVAFTTLQMTSLTSQLLLRHCRWRHSPPSYFYDTADDVTHLPVTFTTLQMASLTSQLFYDTANGVTHLPVTFTAQQMTSLTSQLFYDTAHDVTVPSRLISNKTESKRETWTHSASCDRQLHLLRKLKFRHGCYQHTETSHSVQDGRLSKT